MLYTISVLLIMVDILHTISILLIMVDILHTFSILLIMVIIHENKFGVIIQPTV